MPFHNCRNWVSVRAAACPGSHSERGYKLASILGLPASELPLSCGRVCPVRPGTGTAEASWRGPCPQGVGGWLRAGGRQPHPSLTGQLR